MSAGQSRGLLDRSEPAIVFLIRLCGWSSIIFVFGIFIFIFKEGAPYLFNKLEHEVEETASESGKPSVLFTEIPHEVPADVMKDRINDPFRRIDKVADDGDNGILFTVGAGADSKIVGEETLASLKRDETRSYLFEGVELEVVSATTADAPGTFRLKKGEGGSQEFDFQRQSLVSEFQSDAVRKPIPGVVSAELVSGVDVRVFVTPDAEHEAVVSSIVSELELREDHSHLNKFFLSSRWYPSHESAPEFGILALILGTISVTLLAMLMCVPLGLGAAVFVSEFCTGKIKETLKVVIELLAAIPSVVWGFIGMVVMGPLLVWISGKQPGVNMLNGAIILALMSIPIVVSVGEDALKAVPDSFREAAVALGASRWQVIYKVLFPAARNGLLAAVLLGVGRAIGETMAVLMATGNSAQIPKSILAPVKTLTATIANELPDTSRGDGHYQSLFLIGIVLMGMAFVVNLSADLVVKGIRGKQNA